MLASRLRDHLPALTGAATAIAAPADLDSHLFRPVALLLQVDWTRLHRSGPGWAVAAGNAPHPALDGLPGASPVSPGPVVTPGGLLLTVNGTTALLLSGPTPTAQEQGELHALTRVATLALSHAELRLALAATRSSLARAQTFADLSPVGSAVGTLDGQLIEVNDAYLHLLGYTRADFEGGRINWVDLTPDTERASDEAAFARAFTHGTSGWYEKTMLDRQGQPIPVEVQLLRYHDETDELVIGYVRDLRERRALELERQARAAETEARLNRNESDLAQLAAQLHAQNTELEARTAVLEGFAAFTRDLTEEVDLYALIRRAQQFAQQLLPSGFAVYYEPEGDLWRLKSQVGDLGNPDLQATLDAGISFEGTSNLLIPWQSRRPYYQEQYNHAADGLEEVTAQLQTTATLPVAVNGHPRGIFGFGLNHARPWRRADKAVLESVAQSLGLAIERAEQARTLREHATELEVRTRALEAFAELSRDLTLEPDPVSLVGRAQEIIVNLLPHAVITYYEPQGDHWRLLSHRGHFRNPRLLPVLQRGLPRGQTLNVDRPYTTRAPHYQDQFDPATVAAARQDITDIQATASFPVQSGGRVRGVLVIGRHDPVPWSRVNRRLLDTVLSSLQLALERAEHAQTLQRRTQDLERSNAELEQFAYVASHDLQEPLRTITSFAELLTRRFDTQQDPRVRQYVNHISSGTARMQQLIQDLLSFARVTSQREPPQPTDPNRVLDQLRADLAAPITQTGATLSADPLPTVMVSSTQLRRLLQNLIGNALKFHRPGTPPHVHVSARHEGQEVQFTVQDNGIGIPPEYHDRIFTIFQRLHGRDEYPGTGIGLSVARRIVEGHGGRMGVHSTPGQGTTFWFTLPAAHTDAPAEPQGR
ncbi:ATP-binding protein [Deinococcus radiotolerans]|uniref:histidine kinase n=1 Tax=Deinococcus radiotolerans TaxID=1309407 RepID=A0ABQ2FLV0_9DEIO|nr:ATP-binding protein [Deinococcus radiotolerans]GGL01066.1 hypothetical protein GCM10010844_19370 [Deinococcus radiotolerans]